MGVEVATYINDLDITLPTATDLVSQGDDHLRLIKSVLKNTLPTANRLWFLPRFSSKTTNYSILSTDDETIFLVDTTAGNVTMTLPAVPTTNWRVTVIKVSSDSNQVIISGTVNGGSLANLQSVQELYTIGGNGTSFFNLSNVPRNASITYAKIQNVTNAKLIGNFSGIAASPQEIGISADLNVSASVLGFSTTTAASLGGHFGCILSCVGAITTMTISPGCRMADDVSGPMVQTATYTKTTASWVVGSGNGGIDTGAVAANTGYHWWQIKRTDTGVVDYLFSLSATAPTMPAGYTKKRRIGWAMTNASSQWLKVSQFGNEFVIDIQAIAVSSVGAARVAVVLAGIPSGIPVLAKFRLACNAGGTNFIQVSSLFSTDQTVTNNADLSQQVATTYTAGQYEIMTDASAQIGLKAQTAGVGYLLTPTGWEDRSLIM